MHIHDQSMGGLGALPEATLFQRAQSGCPDSLNALMIRHDGLVQVIVRRQVLGNLPFAEALVWLRHPAHSYALRSLLERHTLTDYQVADALAQHWLRRKGGRHGR